MPRRYRRRRSYGGSYRRSGGYYGRRGYSRRRSFFRSSRKRTAGWRWLLTGIVAGMVVTGMLYINENSLDHWESRQASKAKSLRTAKNQTPKYEFYQMLPQSGEASLSEEIISRPLVSKYLLQVAAFSMRDDAERMRKQVVSWGHKATVVVVSLNGSRWYRVNTGPYASQKAALIARGRLLRHGLEGRLIPVS